MNPFNPTFGDVPKILIDNDPKTTDIYKLVQQSPFARSFFITGVRGSGKTVLLSHLTKMFQQDAACYCIDLLNNDEILTSLAQQLYDQTHSPAAKFFDELGSISIGGFSVERHFNKSSLALTIDKMMAEIQAKHHYVVITIDEVSNSESIRDFAQLFSALKRKQYPIYVIMTSLPELVLDIQNDDKLTFLLRSDKIVMTPLQKAEMISTYAQVFNCSTQLASKLAQATAGYSYAFQLLGYLLFEHCQGKTPTIHDYQAVFPQYQLYLFDNAYQKIFASLSEMDRRYLIAIQGNQKLQTVCEIMEKDKIYVSQYRRRAIERGLVLPSGRGFVKYTLPCFDQYVSEVQNPDSAYYLGY